jgi:hypothetical protein
VLECSIPVKGIGQALSRHALHDNDIHWVSSLAADIGVSPDVDWMGPLYQSAIRYASLYFLREIAEVQAFLVNVYFVGDLPPPTTREDWNPAFEGVNRELSLEGEVPYNASVFLTAE